MSCARDTRLLAMALWKALFLIICISVCQAKRSVVYPRILESRDSDGHKVVSINDDISLRLSRTSVFAQPLTLLSYEGGELKKKMINIDHIEDNLYRDLEHHAAIIIRETSAGTELQGTLKNKFRIKSLPLEPRVNGQVAHVLEEMADDETLGALDLGDYQGHDPIDEEVGATDRIEEDDRSADKPVPDTVYVELLVLSDPTHMVDASLSELIDYLAVYYTAMNMFYMLLTEPKVELRVVGILNLKEQPPYMYTVRNKRGQLVLVTGQTSKRFVNFLNDELDSEKHYDGVVWMTALGIGKLKETRLIMVGGMTFGTMCGQRRLTMVPDYGSYGKTLYITAHELGHVLGAPEDAAGKLPICRGVTGYTMSGHNGEGPIRVEFSECSQVHIRKLLSKQLGPKCWKTNFDYSKVINKGKESPGQQRFLDTYCRKKRRAHLEIDADSHCILMCCEDKNHKGPKCVQEITPNGTICGKNKVCIKEICVDKKRG
ncbi:A disintegrin and metalloproteinase with thrombospondin motifs 15-like [Ornithodoros turicata]|uniref:A disintegrin and metalloproteinase with thrombospondin motifs 15-like n=1 Tax=Ornithodoros turicata TaxID=34597 RepID=UPI003139A830